MPQASLPMSILLQNLRPISVLAVLHSISKEQVTHNTTVPPQWPQFQWHHLVALPPGLQTGHVITIVPAAITRTLNWSNVVTKWIFLFRKCQKSQNTTTVPHQWSQIQWHHPVALLPDLQTSHVITIVPAAITHMLNWSNVGSKWIFSFKNLKKKPKPWKIESWKIRPSTGCFTTWKYDSE